MAINNSITNDFSLAHRDSDIKQIQSRTKTMTLDEIDQHEPNGSTATHIASHDGHYDIGQPLLKQDTSRSIENGSECTLEARLETIDINDFSQHQGEPNILISPSDQLEWMKVDENVHQEAERWRWLVEHSWKDQKLDWLVDEIQTDFINRELKESKDFKQIQRFFHRAKTEMNPIYLIKVYTAPTDFYKHLNKQLAKIGGNFKSSNDQDNRCGIKCYLQILFTHRDFDGMSYIGECYRGMPVTEHDLNQYQVGSQIMNKSFLSTSSDPKVATIFALKNAHKNQQRYTTLCMYKINTRRTALNIAQVSEYPTEKEVLIMPYTAFHIKSIKRNLTNQNDQPNFFIDLEESILESLVHDQKRAIINTRQLPRPQRLKKRFNKWLGNEN